MKLTQTDKMLGHFSTAIVTLLAITMIYPFLNSLAISFNDANDTIAGGISIFPRIPTLLNYTVVLSNPGISNAYLVTIMRTLIGTLSSVLVTSMLAYALTKTQLVGRKLYLGLCFLTLYFSGGLIPFFILIRKLHLINNFLVFILPSMVVIWNMIIFKSFFESLPKSLEESAQIDGCSYFGLFFRIVVPVSGPVFASIILFTAVGHWNNWFDGAIFITQDKLLPMQTLLVRIISSNVMMEQLANMNVAASEMMRLTSKVSTKSLTMATMMVATLPILMIYPFLQKYFAKGVMMGSVKE